MMKENKLSVFIHCGSIEYTQKPKILFLSRFCFHILFYFFFDLFKKNLSKYVCMLIFQMSLFIYLFIKKSYLKLVH